MTITIDQLREPVSGPDAAKLWHYRLEKGVEFRDKHWNGPKAWRAANKLAKGDHWKVKKDPDAVDSESPSDRIKVNLAGSISQDFEAYLMRRSPVFRGEPNENEDDRASAISQGHLLNYFWKEQRMQKQAKRAVRDMINIGHAVMRTGWVMEIDEAKNPAKDGKIELRDIIKEEMPWVKRVNPFRFVFDKDASEYDLESGRWCAEMLLVPFIDMMNSKKYSNDKGGRKIIKMIRDGKVQPNFYDPRMGEGQQEIKETLGLDDNEEFDMYTKLVVIYDVWDKKHNLHFHILAGVADDFLFYEEWPYEHLDGFPFVMGSFIELNDNHYAKGLMIELQDQQHELNRTRTAQFQHKRKLGRTLYQVLESVNDSELTKLRTGKDGDTVKVPNIGAISEVPIPTLPSEFYRAEDNIKQDMQQLSGQNAMMANDSLPSRTSAAEINKRASYSDIKLEDRIAAVDDMILRVGMQVLQHAKAYMKKDKIVRIVGPWGNEWPTLTPEEIQAEADIELLSTSTPKGDTESEKATATNLVNMLLQQLPVLQQMGIQLEVTELFAWLFRKHGAEHEAARFFPGVDAPPGPTIQPQEVEQPGAQQGPGPPPEMGEEQLAAQAEGVQPQSMAQGAQGDLGQF
jgi:hypothetical protein